MTEQAKKYLSDIIQAIDLIENFTVDTKSYHQFSQDLKTQSAVVFRKDNTAQKIQLWFK